MGTLLAVVLISTACWYLFGMALITRWLWNRYPAWLDRWATCPACSGAWYGAAAYAALWRIEGAGVLGMAGGVGIVVAGAAGMVLTPLLAALLIKSLEVAGVESRT